MKLRMRHTVPVVIVAVALGAGSALATRAGGGATDANPFLAAVSDCKPAPARCGSEGSDLEIVAASEAARRMLETVAKAESGESREQAGLSGSLVPEAWGALIDYESLAAANRESPEQAGLAKGSLVPEAWQTALASGSLVPEAWGALIDYESLAAVAR